MSVVDMAIAESLRAASAGRALTPEAVGRIQAYYGFLAAKAEITVQAGFDVRPDELHPSLFPHQADMVRWACKRGRGLIGANFGIGKTRQQCEVLRLTHEKTGKPVMVICPLGARHQFVIEDGAALDMRWRYVTSDADMAAADTPYLITNYERVRDGNITAAAIGTLGGVSLDEGAILGNLGTKTQQEFTRLFADTPYRWVATATPAPNDYRQLIYFADWLGEMDAGQALTRFFGRNPDKAGDLYLLPHMEREFWLWVASWCLLLEYPSDLGYDDTGYIMPELDVQFHRLAADHQKAWDIVDNTGQRFLMKDTAAGVKQAIREKRDSLQTRVAETLRLVAGYLDGGTEQVIVWCGLNDEQRAIEKGLKELGFTYSSIYGSLSVDETEARLYAWKHRETQVLVSKAQMLGSGVNLQQCHVAVYAGIDFKFRDFIQSVHRIQRYGQQQPVVIHLVHTDAEDHVIDVLMQKWEQHRELVARMKGIIREYGLTAEALVSGMQRSTGVRRQETRGRYFTAVNNDTVVEAERFADNSVDCIVTSIPFGNHYEYVASLNDFGHNPQDADFWNQMDYLIPQLYRILKPGRVAAIHCKDRILYGHQNDWHTTAVWPFSDDTNRAFIKHGFIPAGRITVVTDVVRENNSTNRLGWTENSKDSSKMGVGLPEYVLLFRKPQSDVTRSYADEPVRKDKKEYSRARWQIDAHSFWRSNGNRSLTPEELIAFKPELLAGMDTGQIYHWWTAFNRTHPYNYEAHVAMGEALEGAGAERLPAKFMLFPPQAPELGEAEDYVWTDILFMRTLNMEQSRRRQEKHVCPLPFDIVDRLIERFSNPGEIVLDPFGGVFTVPVRAVALGRTGYGVELNATYWEYGVRYLRDAEEQRSAPTLFDLLALEEETAAECEVVGA